MKNTINREGSQLLEPYMNNPNRECSQLLSVTQVFQLLQELPRAVGEELHEMLNAVLKAQAPGPFSEALGELEVYLSALEAASVVSFDKQIQLKAYVMVGWETWRSSFQTVAHPHGCPYCGANVPTGDDLTLDQWGYFHCREDECGARLKLDENGQAIGYINKTYS
ncbi:hypothetical protein C1X35_19005 [Pseudomonas sp. FW306-1C-G01A]|uniref:hypothetical protein n=1 Tax=unclassified Pseudomonas TaxID=196821 RepID=UPI000C86A040|nr:MULTISPECIES: hypothetical protein [unclassified Pseudomonas]PMV86690.1 hypothetical protein C1X56_13655 [Pseudomonas sp. GW101-1A09]PMV94447.1 hypothetical protein C1X51_12305 [Pseudomonas sp. FW306-2-2C-B10A]PMW04345.1 hypothetical protein C1X50_17970 [Pseudomonas sp. MPR-TSA4]PMW11472.1 hypothetical protein C1X52_21235 [Pseudomonas sp. FW306-2-1A-C05A]PMW33365.1 hypothetical protein C1X48_22845 [Pseudomonas sp. FW305-3-2-15-A-R2A1]